LAAHATVLWPHGPLVPRPPRNTRLTANDVLSHYDYNAPLTSFMHIVRNLMVGYSLNPKGAYSEKKPRTPLHNTI
jgi:hypothetical protein